MCWLVPKWTRTCSAYQFGISANCVILFLGLGLMETLIGPTLLDRANHIGSTLTEIASIFFLRGAGYMVGGAIMGVLGDCFKQHTYLLLCLATLWSIVMGVAQALSYSLVMLCFMTFIYEIGSAGIDNGVHRVVLKVWDKRAGPHLQLIDLSYSFGAFVAPLLAQPFLIQQQGSNVTCTSHDPANGSTCDAECLQVACLLPNTSQQHICNGTGGSVLSSPFPRFAWAYIIAVVPWLCGLIAFAIISGLTENFSCFSSRPSSLAKVSDHHTQPKSNCCSPCNLCLNNARHWRPRKGAGRIVVIYSIAFLLISIYYGLSFAYGGLVFTFAVETLHFDKVAATNLNSLFYGTFTAGGIVSIVLLLMKAPLGVLLILNVVGSLVSTLMMAVFPSNPTAIWLGTGGLGASMASVYATTYAWLAKEVPMNGMGMAVMIAAVSIADMVHAAVLGILLEHTTPYLLLYYALGNVLVSCVIVAAMLVTAHIWKDTEVRDTVVKDTEVRDTVVKDTEVRDTVAEHEGTEMSVACSSQAMVSKLSDHITDQIKGVDVISSTNVDEKK